MPLETVDAASPDACATEAAAPAAVQLTVVIPTLNERENVAPMVARLRDALKGLRWEAIFVDDGSIDGTAETIAGISRKDPSIRLMRRHRRRGLASAVIDGGLETTAPVVAVIDADGQHDEAILPQLYATVAAGAADVAVGTRYTGGGSLGDLGDARARISRVATRATAIATGTRLSDPMSGYFAISQRALLDALPRLSNIGFKILLDLLLSSPRALTVVEHPYRFRSRAAGVSKLDSVVIVQFVAMLLEKRIGRWMPTRLAMFLSVGALGLLVHLVVLKAGLSLARVNFELAQITAVIAAIAFNFFLNNAFTYHDRRLRGWSAVRGLASFYLVCGFGAFANVGIAELLFTAEHRWWLAGLAGAAVGALWNYAVSSFLTWQIRS